ncbi:hypothetical protein MG351_003905 [Escherichia coli]|uniref:hypothetical protein n=1 Tax=Escherichia coli TaxID=562 RepID=UPI0012FFABBF|nr:hypothetical protein [Escherichia coli]EIX4807803.1 hypothetical protein [Escherichia coli]
MTRSKHRDNYSTEQPPRQGIRLAFSISIHSAILPIFRDPHHALIVAFRDVC